MRDADWLLLHFCVGGKSDGRLRLLPYAVVLAAHFRFPDHPVRNGMGRGGMGRSGMGRDRIAPARDTPGVSQSMTTKKILHLRTKSETFDSFYKKYL